MGYYEKLKANLGSALALVLVGFLAGLIVAKSPEKKLVTPTLTNAVRKEQMLTDCIYRSNDKQFCANAVSSTYPIEMLKVEWEFAFREKDQAVAK